jgi:hypothetical protein
MVGGIGSEREVPEVILADFAIQREQDTQASLYDRAVCTCHINVVTTGVFVSCLGEAARYQELRHRGMGKLNDPRIIYFDDGEKTRAHRQHSIFRIFWATTRLELGKGSCVKIKCKELCKFLNKKGAGRHQNTLQEKVGRFPHRVGDIL